MLSGLACSDGGVYHCHLTVHDLGIRVRLQGRVFAIFLNHYNITGTV